MIVLLYSIVPNVLYVPVQLVFKSSSNSFRITGELRMVFLKTPYYGVFPVLRGD